MHPDEQLSRYLVDLQVATWLGVAVDKVRRWAMAGTLPCIILPDGSFLFEPAEVSQWLKSLPPRRTNQSGSEVAHAT